MPSDFSFGSLDLATPRDALGTLLVEHQIAFDAYEKFRSIKALCYGTAKNLAGDKPVTDTYIERAVEQEHGADVLEDGKRMFHRLQALAIQIQGLSALVSTIRS